MLWNLVLRKGNLSHSTAIDQLGGLQPVPLALWAQGSHQNIGVRTPTAQLSYEASMHMNVLILGAHPRAWHTVRAPGTLLVFLILPPCHWPWVGQVRAPQPTGEALNLGPRAFIVAPIN